MEDGHGSHDEENILQDTREGKDEGRGLANLEVVSILIIASGVFVL